MGFIRVYVRCFSFFFFRVCQRSQKKVVLCVLKERLRRLFDGMRKKTHRICTKHPQACVCVRVCVCVWAGQVENDGLWRSGSFL